VTLQVINTVKSDYFQREIAKALIDRKQKQALTQNKFIEMNADMLQLITGSNHVSTGKPNCHHHLLHSKSRQSSESSSDCFKKEGDAAIQRGTCGGRNYDQHGNNGWWPFQAVQPTSSAQLLADRRAEASENDGSSTVQSKLSTRAAIAYQLSVLFSNF
jgi:hypothetical protein